MKLKNILLCEENRIPKNPLPTRDPVLSHKDWTVLLDWLRPSSGSVSSTLTVIFFYHTAEEAKM